MQSGALGRQEVSHVHKGQGMANEGNTPSHMGIFVRD